MKIKKNVLFGFIICIYSCNNIVDPNERFFIPQCSINEGIINKYYVTAYPANNSDTKTNLEYSYIKKINDSLYVKEMYNPAFKLESTRKFSINNNNAKEISYQRFYPMDTLTAVYPENTTANYITFDKDTAYYSVKLKNKDSISIKIDKSTLMLKDTLVEEKSAKIIEQITTKTTFFGETLKDTFQYRSRSIYVQDLGLWKSTVTTDTQIKERILVAQLLPEQFDTLSKHGIKRVGYIDFDDTIDADATLALCSSHARIVDYYNGGNDRSGFIGGKGNLKKFIDKKLDNSKLNDESGYLTLRFVINCKGQAGKFVTNEVDFDYNEKQFSKQTVMHLYDIVSSIERWKPCVIRNIKRDSYIYVTFILKNGKIQDILP
ncbi:hypothetical protein ATE84_3397 [Aquimarina sp. MAR_2010_214]|uniref:hypothetical protein n=1 Tax=Aquimarina sp. MAR_2010_214 TaxID=1250026 RepID=UPI000C6FD2CD|nr:hypothetical protein [Aquimarina sp. MAR_2010_214]PKV51322.1 hypothetical protein ATE84_3397 [Aquimarina sp. MAR_2010_214]